MFPFAFWLSVVVITYSANPHGQPPYHAVQVNLIEFSEEACRDTLIDAQLRPKPLIRTFAVEAPTLVLDVTVFPGFRCREFTATDPN